MAERSRVVVIGGGAFGGWSALTLRRAGHEVTLVEAWSPGHARSSSGGASRIVRRSYPNPAMARLADRAIALWREEGRRAAVELFVPIGLLWMFPRFGEDERAVAANLGAIGAECERLDPAGLARRFPQVRTDDLEGALFEPGAGFAHAREACRHVTRSLVAEGGAIVTGWATLGPIAGGRLESVALSDGTTLTADAYVLAGGPWLRSLLPGRVDSFLRVTRQEVFTFGTLPGDARHGPDRFPAWCWNGDRFWYGVPGDGSVGGFKVADDTRGPGFDPTLGARTPTADGQAAARAFLEDRFPGLDGAPLIDAAVCQYAQTLDDRFLADRHPEAANLFVVGGGSGHGFKHGPAVGEYAASLVTGDREPGGHPAFRVFADSP